MRHGRDRHRDARGPLAPDQLPALNFMLSLVAGHRLLPSRRQRRQQLK
jgi:hypothetical protein